MNLHTPAPPYTPEPPSRLVAIAGSLSHPAITRVGLTTTSEGTWALMVRTRAGTLLPLPEVEAVREDFPVIYQDEPEEPPLARPAYPGLGE
jgi:hypothetical protein